jgi:DNA-directed RNA polymerase specialized sigma24 family protein
MLDAARRAACGLTCAERDDIVQEVLARLIRIGPRNGDRGPDSDEEVVRYLKGSLRNEAISRFRRAGRELTVELNFDIMAGPHSSPEQQLDAKRATRVLTWARCELYERIVQRIAEELTERGGDGLEFLKAVQQLRAIADGRTTFARIMAKERRKGGRDSGVQGRVYQRHARARLRVATWAETNLRHAPLTDSQKWALCTVLGELQPRISSRRSFAEKVLRAVRRGVNS